MTPSGKPQTGDWLIIDGHRVEVLERGHGQNYCVYIAHPSKGRTLMVDAAYYIETGHWKVEPGNQPRN